MTMTTTEVLEALKLVTNGPSTQVDAVLKTICYRAKPTHDENELRRLLHAALDFTVHGSLAPGLVVQLLCQCWRDMGGTRDDVAYHRDDDRILTSTDAAPFQPGQRVQVRLTAGLDYAFVVKEEVVPRALYEAIDTDAKTFWLPPANMHPIHPLEELARDA